MAAITVQSRGGSGSSASLPNIIASTRWKNLPDDQTECIGLISGGAQPNNLAYTSNEAEMQSTVKTMNRPVVIMPASKAKFAHLTGNTADDKEEEEPPAAVSDKKDGGKKGGPKIPVGEMKRMNLQDQKGE